MKSTQAVIKNIVPKFVASLLCSSALLSTVAAADTLPAQDTFSTHGLASFEKSVYDMNDSGITSGRAAVNITGDTIHRAVLWDEFGQLIDLDPGSDIPSIARGLNNHNDAVGSLSTIGAVLFSQGTITPLLDQNGNSDRLVRAEDINDNGLIVGCANDIPVQWNNSLIAQAIPGTPAGVSGCAATANNQGHIVGHATINGAQRAVLWRDGIMLDLGVLPGHEVSRALGINEFGQVVGSSSDLDGSNGNARRPFLWDQGVLTDLGVLSGNTGTAADINNAGEIVGSAPGPFWWRSGFMYDLSPVAPLMRNAVAINTSGQIAGTSRVLTPAPGQLDLALSMTGPTENIPSGQEFDIKIKLTNISAADGNNVIVTDYLAADFILVSVTSTQGVCSVSNPTGNPIPRDATPVACELGTVLAQTTVDITIRVRPEVAFSTSQTLYHRFDSAFVTAAEDVNSANNLDSISLRIIPPPEPEGADIAVSHSSSPEPVKRNRTLTFTTDVINHGPEVALNAGLRLSISTRFSFVSANSTRGSCARTEYSIIECDFGDMPATENARVEVKIKPKDVGTFFSGAIVSSDSYDRVISNNNRAIRFTVVR